MNEQIITIFTDGSSRGNPGPGGWGAVLVLPKQNEKNNELGITNYGIEEIGGREEHTTNNRMELVAVIQALSIIHNSSFIIRVYTDSNYLINGITKWVHGWKNKNWKTSTKEDVLNRDLWQSLDRLCSNKKIEWKYVGGHIGVEGNERCDEIATSFALGEQPKLYSGPISGYFVKNILDVSNSLSFENVAKIKKEKQRKSAKAYSYVSLVSGMISVDKSWKDCEARVKGKSKVRYQKSISAEDEKKIIEHFLKQKKQS